LQGDVVDRKGRGTLHRRPEPDASGEDFPVSVPIGTKHRTEKLSANEPLVISEVKIGDYCEEGALFITRMISEGGTGSPFERCSRKEKPE